MSSASTNRSASLLRLGLPAVAMAVALVAIAVIVWQLPRGFDPTDEAWAVTLIANNRVTVGEAWGFHHLVHPVFVLFGDSVLALRILRLIGYVAIGAIAVATARVVAARFDWRIARPWWLLIAASTQLGTIAAWSYPPQYLSYNELSAWLSQVCAVLLVLAVVAPAAGRATVALWTGTGAAVGILLLAKAPAGAAMLVVALTVLGVNRRGIPWWARLVSAIAGGLAAVTAAVVTGFPLAAYLGNLLGIVTGGAAVEDNTHSAGTLIASYISSAAGTMVGAGAMVLAIAVIIIGALLLESDRGVRRRAGSAALTVGGLVAAITAGAWLRFADPFSQLGYLAATIGGAFILGTALASRRDPVRPRLQGMLIVVILLVTPFAAAVGTNNELFGQLLYCLTLWVAAFATVLARLASEPDGAPGARPSVSHFALAGIMVGLLIISSTQMLLRTTAPYRTAPLVEQDTPAPGRPLAGILLVESEERWAEQTIQAGRDQAAEGVPTVAMDSPGALLLFNASPFASPRISDHWPISFASIVAACADTQPDDLIVLQPARIDESDATYSGVRAALLECGVDFPADFHLVDTIATSSTELGLRVWRTSND